MERPNSAGTPEFGEKIDGQEYQWRPGSYGVVLDPSGRIAVMQTAKGCYLPGGGAEEKETPEYTLHREVREECGLEIVITKTLGNAVQFVFAEGEGYFQKPSAFFEAIFAENGCGITEAGSILIWLAPAEAVKRLKHQSQIWAVRRRFPNE